MKKLLFIVGLLLMTGQTMVVNAQDKQFTVNGESFYMVYVEKGSFWMGAQNRDRNGQNYDPAAGPFEGPVHKVTLSSYYIGEFEVTQKLWKAVMGNNPSKWQGNNLDFHTGRESGDNRPVENVSWFDCQNFINKLNELTGEHFRMPTEAEWEFAARGGNDSENTRYSGSNDINEVAYYTNNSSTPNRTQSNNDHLERNELDIVNMSGNVREWVSDWAGDYPGTDVTNPQGPDGGEFKICRGGCFRSNADECTVWKRFGFIPNISNYQTIEVGLRLALSADDEDEDEEEEEEEEEESMNTEESLPADRIINNPAVNYTGVNNIKINKVHLTPEYTAVEITYTNLYQSNSCSFDKRGHITANGVDYTLTRAEGIAIYPNKTEIQGKGATLTFTLYFPAIPAETTSFDLIESESSKWKWYGISVK